MKKKNFSQLNNQEEGFEIDLSVLLSDLLHSFKKLWWIAALLAAFVAAGSLILAIQSYTPRYKAEATFTVETYNTNQSGYTFFYDNHTASQMAQTFPYLLDSDLLLGRVKADLGVEMLNGTPKAKVIENSNLFTLSVTSNDAQAAYDILQSLIKNYPAVAEYVIGKTQLNMIDHPEFPTTPENKTEHLKAVGSGAFIGFMLGMCIIAVYAILRNTVRQEVDITDKLHTYCLGTVPLVVPKGKRKEFDLSIKNRKVGTPFKESFRGLALQTVRMMENKQVLMITATDAGEGTTTVARNLADALIEQGKKVCLLDRNEAKPAKIESAKAEYDYVLIDAPECSKLSKVTPIAERAEMILYTVRQDSAKLPRVKNCFEDLNQFDAKLLGCVLNGVRSGLTGYGYGYSYGYGYGYGMGYGYGRYGNYGYGEDSNNKVAEEE